MGIGISWAKSGGKLAFGGNTATSDLTIWDGFRNVQVSADALYRRWVQIQETHRPQLPEIPNINFWLSLRFTIHDGVGKSSTHAFSR